MCNNRNCTHQHFNSAAIELNNRAVAHLAQGDVIAAFELVTKASQITMKGISNHQHVDAGNSTFRFHWEDCDRARDAIYESKRRRAANASVWEGSSAYLFLRGLRITVNNEVNVDDLCACGFAWAIWFNQAVCCSVIGTMLGEKGQKMLELGFDMYTRVQKRISSEPPSKHWNMLLMGVVNNIACIYKDFCMIKEMRECLEELAETILASKDVDAEERRTFCLNLQVLGSDVTAAAA
jgi:hypothetical protein